LSREEREQLPERKRIGFIDQEGREFKEKKIKERVDLPVRGRSKKRSRKLWASFKVDYRYLVPVSVRYRYGTLHAPPPRKDSSRVE